MPSAALVTLFNNCIANNGAGLYIARLYTIQLFGGGVLRFTDGDFDVKAVSTSPAPAPVNGFAYTSSGPRIDQKQSKTQAHWKTGLDVDSYTLVLMPRPFDPVTGATFPDTIGSVPFLQACAGGALDAADFQVDEAYFLSLPTWPLPPGGAQNVDCRTIFAGKIGAVDTTNAVAVLTVNDYRDLLSISMPRHFYQAQCRHTLFDVNCNADGNMNAAVFGINGLVASGSTQSVISASGLPAPAGSRTYTQGRLVMTSGLNVTFQRTIKSWDGAFGLSLLAPLPFAVAVGDGFTAYPGCNKLFATCQAFNNSRNHGGQTNIPPPETAF
jgi:hypothetical protein